eukprot:2995051-Amphidinium_carterae.1
MEPHKHNRQGTARHNSALDRGIFADTAIKNNGSLGSIQFTRLPSQCLHTKVSCTCNELSMLDMFVCLRQIQIEGRTMLTTIPSRLTKKRMQGPKCFAWRELGTPVRLHAQILIYITISCHHELTPQTQRSRC